MDLNKKKFANTLTVLAQATEDENVFVVTWSSGIHRQGKITVDIPIEVNDKLVISELAVMQYIIDELDALGNEPALKGVQMIFSSPAIKKIHSNKSDKYHLYPYSYFLTTRFLMCDVKITDDASWILPRADNNLLELKITEPFGQMIHIPGYGKVAITKHIIDQYSRRMNNIEADQAWKILTKTLAHGNLRELNSNEQRKGHDQANHEQEGLRLFDSITRWCFVIAPNSYGRNAIVTSYIR